MQPAERMVVGIDGAFVKAKRSHGRRHFEVLTGRIEASGSRVGAAFAVVRDLDPMAKPRVRALLRRHGLTSDTALTVLTDGEEGIRGVVRTFLGQRPRYVLDWFHLSRRLARIRQAFSYLPNSSKLKQNEFARLLRGIASARWRLWHGRPARARGALLLLRSDLQYLLIALRAVAPEKLQASDESRVEWVRGLVQELDKYLLSNWRALTNYCEERQTGQRIATSHVESTVNQVINQRMCKKQQMRWTRPGAQYLLHARTAEINGELARFTGLRRLAGGLG